MLGGMTLKRKNMKKTNHVTKNAKSMIFKILKQSPGRLDRHELQREQALKLAVID